LEKLNAKILAFFSILKIRPVFDLKLAKNPKNQKKMLESKKPQKNNHNFRKNPSQKSKTDIPSPICCSIFRIKKLLFNR
jgi:hypothetical protein